MALLQPQKWALSNPWPILFWPWSMPAIQETDGRTWPPLWASSKHISEITAWGWFVEGHNQNHNLKITHMPKCNKSLEILSDVFLHCLKTCVTTAAWVTWLPFPLSWEKWSPSWQVANSEGHTGILHSSSQTDMMRVKALIDELYRNCI